jgi:hypothetical protein
LRLDLAERLRCPAAHEATPLVVVAKRVVDRELVVGFAGCPVCQLEARVVDGVVHFDAPFAITIAGDGRSAEGGAATADDAALERTAALLNLAEPGGAVLLAGRYGELARALRERFDVTTAVITGSGPVPFTDQTFRAAAVDAGEDSEMAADAARTVSIGGRFLLPATRRLPPAVHLLAEDDHEKVGERESASPIIPLGRAAPPHTTNR